MKNRPRRIVALLLTLSLLVLNVLGCGKEDTGKADNVNSQVSITRGEWIETLSKGFGMDEFTNTTPYYKDVDENNEIYKYVQSCYEWDVLSTGTDVFKPNDTATLGFVISTAVLAADLDYSKYETGDLNTALIKCAKDNNIYDIEPDSEELLSGVTAVEATVILQSAINSYFVMDEAQEKCDMGYKKEVEVLPADKKVELPVTGNSVVEEKTADEYSEGDIFVVPASAEYPNGAAFKVVSKKLNADGTYTIETAIPEIWEVFDEIDVNKMEMADPSNFEPAEGVTIIDNSSAYNDITRNIMAVDRYSVSSLDNVNDVINETKTFKADGSNEIALNIDFSDDGLKVSDDFSTKFNGIEDKLSIFQKDANYENFKKLLGKTNILPTEDYFKNSISGIDDYLSGKIDLDQLEKELKKTKEEYDKLTKEDPESPWEKGYKVSGTVKFEAGVNVRTDIKFGFFKVKVNSFSVDVYDKFTSELKVEGTIGREFDLGSVPVPIGAGFSLEFGLKLFIEFDGSLSYKYELSCTDGLAYEDGKWKKTHTDSSSHTFEAAVSAEVGIKGYVDLKILCFDLAEVELSISAKAVAKSSLSKTMDYTIDKTNKIFIVSDKWTIASEVNIYVPLVSFSIGGDGTLLDYIGINREFNLVTEDNAPKIPIYSDEYEIKGEEKKYPIHGEKTTTEQGETTTKKETTTTENQNPSISLSAYVVSLSQGESQKIAPTLPAGYSESDLKWSTSDASVATVSNGVITGVSEGSAIITVTTKDGSYKGQCNVLVD